jgi:hypothetical protein
VNGQCWIGPGAGPAVVAGRHFADRCPEMDECLDFGGYVEAAVPAHPVQRLDPQRIAGQVDPAGAGLRDGDGVLTAEPADRVRPPQPEGLEHHLGVTAAAQLDSQRAQFGPDLMVVEDLAVEAQHPAAVRAAPWLHGPVPCHDRQPPRAGQHPGAAQRLGHFATRSQRVQHGPESGRIGACTRDQGNPAHVYSPPIWSRFRRSRCAPSGLRHTCQV